MIGSTVDFFGPMANEAYHADHTAVSKTALSLFRESRRLYEAEYITHTAPPRKTTKAMELGDLAHAALLEPERLETDYVYYPEDILSSNGAASTIKAKDFKEKHTAAGRVVLKREDFKTVAKMVQSIREVCKPWLAMPAKREHAIYWTHDESGLRLKCKPDWLIIADDRCFVFDPKTSNDPRPEAAKYKAEDFQWWLQEAHYREGIEAATGKPVEWYWICPETEFPFRCSICAFDDETRMAGAFARRKLLLELADCINTNNFAELWEGKVNTISCRKSKIDSSATTCGR